MAKGLQQGAQTSDNANEPVAYFKALMVAARTILSKLMS